MNERRRGIMASFQNAYWRRRELGNAAADVLGPNLAVAGALSRAWRLGGNPAGWGPNVKGKAAP